MRSLLFALALSATSCAAPLSVPPANVIVHVAPEPLPSPTCTYGDEAKCRSACDAGDAPSCNNLGAMIESGLAPGDLRDAAKLYARACHDGATAGCTNAKRLDARTEPASPAPRSAAPAPPEPPASPASPAPTREDPPAPPPPSLAELRDRCAKGDRGACDALPGIHISGNVHIHGNVTIVGDVFLHGGK